MIETIWLIFYELPLVRMSGLCPDISILRLTFYHGLMYTLGLNHISGLKLKLP